ncbi:MAG: hypothetical protein L6R43_04535 [Planctomycetes bacterium]|nr:hypothetical protein [Planctomycetota bacterium]
MKERTGDSGRYSRFVETDPRAIQFEVPGPAFPIDTPECRLCTPPTSHRWKTHEAAAVDLFEGAVRRLFENFGSHRFFTERDVVAEVQRALLRIIETHHLPLGVFHDFRIGSKRGKGPVADLVIVGENEVVLLASEWKFEPNHARATGERRDLLERKFPVVIWQEVVKDMDRARDFAESHGVPVSYAILVDEGGHFRERKHKGIGCGWRVLERGDRGIVTEGYAHWFRHPDDGWQGGRCPDASRQSERANA